MQRLTPRPPQIALALSALQESIKGIELTQLPHEVGVSAGSFMGAGLANGITSRALCASFIENDDEPSEAFDRSWLLAPAFGEFARCAPLMRPGRFPPVQSADGYPVDGAVKKTMHATLHHGALDGRKRLLCAPLQVPTDLGPAILKLQANRDDVGHVVTTAAHKETTSW